jgi:AcrR family transcriptional regulator
MTPEIPEIDRKLAPNVEIGSDAMPLSIENSDGRHARRDRGKQTVLETSLEIFREGGVIESMAHLAERSGVSERTLFRYFTNQDGLIDAVASYIFPQLVPFFTLQVPPGSLDERMRSLVELRVGHTQMSAPMARTLERFERQFSIASELRRARDDAFHEQLLTWLGDDAQDLDEESIALIDTLIGFNSLDKLLAKIGPKTADAVHHAVMTIISSQKK